MPDWLINLLVQYPVATLNGLVAWYAWKQVREKETASDKRNDEKAKEIRLELRAATENEIKRLQDAMTKAYSDHLASKDAEIERITKQFTDELKKLAKKIDEGAKKNPD